MTDKPPRTSIEPETNPDDGKHDGRLTFVLGAPIAIGLAAAAFFKFSIWGWLIVLTGILALLMAYVATWSASTRRAAAAQLRDASFTQCYQWMVTLLLKLIWAKIRPEDNPKDTPLKEPQFAETRSFR